MEESVQSLMDNPFVIVAILDMAVRSASNQSVPMAIAPMEDVALFKMVTLSVIAQEQIMVEIAVLIQSAFPISVLMGVIVTFMKEVHTAIVPRTSEEIGMCLPYLLTEFD